MGSPTNHIPSDRQADLVEGRLPAARRAEVLGHVASCGRCASEIAALERVVRLMRTDDSVDPPAQVVSRAVSLFRPRAAPVPLGLRQRLAAALRFDSAAAPGLAYGLRSGLVAERQMLFSAGELDIELRVAPAGAALTVAGQVLGPCAGGQVELRGADSAVMASLTDLCEFVLPSVPAGTYTLALHLSDADVEVAGLELKA
ncbi:MAG TPA: hypothetical protein VG370_32535 [Chloroflexota bacterium]|nr:hypothetical protein [Chloroflexota bacterium]